MTEAILALVVEERRRQDARWGAHEQAGDGVMLAVLGEEFGEVCRAMNDLWPNPPDKGQLLEELIQVAAVAVRWSERLVGEVEGEKKAGP